MSKTLPVLCGLAGLWLTAWGIAGYKMAQAGSEKLAQAEHIRTPATTLERGADVRMEGTIVEGPSTLAPYSQRPCLAAWTRILVTSHYSDSQNKQVYESQLIATRTVGPPDIDIAVGDKRLALPLERWTPTDYTSEAVDEIPLRLGVKQEEIDSAKARARGSIGRYRIVESTIDEGTRFFVVGRIEDRDGPLRLEPDRVLGRVELYPGSQEDLVKQLGGSGSGLRIAGMILGAGVGPLPLAIIGLVLLYERLRVRRVAQSG